MPPCPSVTTFTWTLGDAGLVNALLDFPYGNFGQVNSFLCLILPIKQELQYYPNSGKCNQSFREMQNKFPRDTVILVNV